MNVYNAAKFLKYHFVMICKLCSISESFILYVQLLDKIHTYDLLSGAVTQEQGNTNLDVVSPSRENNTTPLS
ncbi:hypothetical protein OIPHN330_14850 [Citrobacter freundii]|nr:hypothetical protein OIPHN330_14850 [Citrobacter freundii]BEJ38771.1 hypothetical protein OIPHN354_14830 [Citrobacter freundii]